MLFMLFMSICYARGDFGVAVMVGMCDICSREVVGAAHCPLISTGSTYMGFRGRFSNQEFLLLEIGRNPCPFFWCQEEHHLDRM